MDYRNNDQTPPSTPETGFGQPSTPEAPAGSRPTRQVADSENLRFPDLDLRGSDEQDPTSVLEVDTVQRPEAYPGEVPYLSLQPRNGNQDRPSQGSQQQGTNNGYRRDYRSSDTIDPYFELFGRENPNVGTGGSSQVTSCQSSSLPNLGADGLPALGNPTGSVGGVSTPSTGSSAPVYGIRFEGGNETGNAANTTQTTKRPNFSDSGVEPIELFPPDVSNEEQASIGESSTSDDSTVATNAAVIAPNQAPNIQPAFSAVNAASNASQEDQNAGARGSLQAAPSCQAGIPSRPAAPPLSLESLLLGGLFHTATSNQENPDEIPAQQQPFNGREGSQGTASILVQALAVTLTNNRADDFRTPRGNPQDPNYTPTSRGNGVRRGRDRSPSPKRRRQ